IALLTKSREWTPPQRRMMGRASRVYGLRGLTLAVLVALATWIGIESYGNLRAAGLVESLDTASTSEDPAVIKQLAGYRRWADSRLRRMLRDSEETSPDHLHASLALLEVDPSQVGFLIQRLLSAGPGELSVLREALKPEQSHLTPRLWSVLESVQPGGNGL